MLLAQNVKTIVNNLTDFQNPSRLNSEIAKSMDEPNFLSIVLQIPFFYDISMM